MSEILYTRKDLRRAVALELQMPFFRRFTAGQLTSDTTSSSTKVVDIDLRQKDGFWDGSWFFGLSTGDMSLIRSFNAQAHEFFLETERPTPADAELYEIHTTWNAIELHDAINRAILLSGKTFPETVVDISMILEEDKLSYTVSGLTEKPWFINKVWLECASTTFNGTASAGGASSITLQSVPTDINTNWKISIYKGTGAGQIRNYASAVGNVVTVGVAWTTIPDSTSKYVVWNPTVEENDWLRLSYVYQDAKEYPDTLRLRAQYPSSYGMRLRIEYLSVPTELTADTDETVVPKEYVVPMACSLLHSRRVSNTRSDREMHYAESEKYRSYAQDYVLRNAPHTPDTYIPISDESMSVAGWENPLDWEK